MFGFLHKLLLNIINLSIRKGVFPHQLKIYIDQPVYKPVYKNRDKTSLWNYRPISDLLSFSKLLERIVYNRLYKHSNSNDILYRKQFGFQKGHLTDIPDK